MRSFFFLLLSCGLAGLSFGQEAKPAQQEEQAKPPETGAEPVSEAQPAAEAVPDAQEPMEIPFTGSVEIGYRWLGDLRGNSEVYRSVVNLGEGPRLLGADFTYVTPGLRWLDRVDVRAQGWGGDPQSTVRVNASRQGAYHLLVDHRDMAYFNALPSFANPALERGILFSQRTFDIQRRYTNFELDIRPGARFIPYIAYTHDNGSGRGVTTFVGDANEYPVANRLSDRTANARGGVRVELNRMHVTLEQGTAFFRDDQEVFTSDRNLGNRTTPFLGQTLFLQTLTQTYGVRGRIPYSKALFTGRPVSWLDLYGQFMFSQPKTDTSYAQENTGQFAVLPAAIVNAQQLFLLAAAKQPHTTGTFGGELRPHRRVRVIESIRTDRFHNASSIQGPQIGDRLEFNYSQQQIDALFDLTSRLTVRGGHRYVWGESRVRAPQLLSDFTNLRDGELRRHVGLAGLSYRSGQRLSITGDLEVSPGDRAYFRTSLNEYQRARVRARYQVRPSLSLSANGSLLDNQNPTQLGEFDLENREFALAGFWTPREGRRVRVLAEYARSFFRTDVLYRVPQTLEPDRSFYRDNAHIGTALIDIAMPSTGVVAPRLSFGGSLFASTGSRPTRFYQPQVRFSVPVFRHVSWNAEWRWYAMSEQFYAFEDFRGHQAIFSLRFF